MKKGLSLVLVLLMSAVVSAQWDRTAPKVVLTAPTSGAIVSGTVALVATATDNVKVYGVQFYVDSAVLGSEDRVAPYTVAWDSTRAANGTHTVSARARDASGNSAITSVTFTVKNVPLPCTLTLSASVPSTGTAGTSAAFSAVATPAHCTGTLAYSWAFGDGGTATTQSVQHTYASAGAFGWTVSASIAGVTATRSGTITVSAPPTWVLVWGDEFEGTVLDRTKWGTIYPFNDIEPPDPTDEQEWYVDDDSAHVVSDGTLKLIATRGSTQPRSGYTSGLIHSYPALVQAYGRFEARMKLPKGNGLWPAFWLMPAPITWPPEIDVMENLARDPRTIYFTHHWSANYPYPGSPQGGEQGSSIQTVDLSAGFHVYAVEWSPTSLVWYLDGVKVWQASSHLPVVGYGWTGMYVIVNLAVGAAGSWPGAPDATTVFPATLEVDYVRVYSKQ